MKFRTPLAALGVCLLVVLATPILFPNSYEAAHAQAIEKEYAEEGTDPVITFNVEDPEGGGLVWSLSGDDTDDFSVDDGVLSFAVPPDYEAPTDADSDNTYRVTVESSDGPNTDTSDVTVTVTNVDEDGEIALSSVQPEVGTPYTATLDDPDGGVSNIVWLWEISSDRTTWNAMDGATSNSYTPVDDDEGNYLRITVTYNDAHGAGKSAQAVSDHAVGERQADNQAPEFPASETGVRSVAEDASPGTEFGDPVEATDEHHQVVLTYSLSGTDATSFDIVRTSGQLLTKARLDYETRDSYSVAVRVSDPSNESDEITVTINVANVDEQGTITLSSAQPFVDTAFSAVLDDPDGGVSEITWLWEGSQDRMTWAEIAGEESDSYMPVDEDVGSYLRVTASYTDGEGSGKSAQRVSANTVREPTDHAPTFPSTETGVRTVPENTPPGTDIGDPFAAIDEDGHILTYFLLDSSDADSFDLDETTGQLRTKDPLDYETKSLYSITVAVHDSGEEHGDDDHSADATLVATILVTDVDETPSSFCITEGAVEESESNAGLVSDCEALLSARETLARDAVLNWSAGIPIVKWDGVDVRGTPERVTRLHLNDRGLDGEIPAVLKDLTGLELLYLHNNGLRGEIPDLSGLIRLERLWLNGNNLTGGVPDRSSLPRNLTQLNLHNNQLEGGIPSTLGELPMLEGLWIHRNDLTGQIPAELGNLANLKWLWLYGNQLEGSIPAELGDLSKIVHLNLHSNRLTGSIPSSLDQLSGLEGLWLHRNDLTGQIPTGLGSLASLEWLYLYGNSLTGGIPTELANLANLKRLHLSDNELEGEIPSGLGEIPGLTHLMLQQNRLTGGVPAELADLSDLEWLSLYGNQLTGGVPWVLGDLVSLKRLYLHNNELTGEIPAELGQLSNLTNLWLNGNQLTGTIPSELGELSNLERWRLRDNRLTGCVPEGLAAVEDSDLDALGLEVC